MAKATNPYAAALRITAIATLAAAAVLTAFFVVKAAGVRPSPLFVMAAPLLLFGLILLPILFFVGRRMQREVQALLDGGSLAHWRYAEDEWHRFAETDWARTRRQSVKRIPEVLGLSAVAGVVLPFIRPVSFGRGLLLGVVMGIVLGPVIAGLTYWWGRSTYRARLSAPGEAFIGSRGVYQNAQYTTWAGTGMRLGGVSLEVGDPVTLSFDIVAPRGNRQSARVAVPRGKEDEARALIAQLGF